LCREWVGGWTGSLAFLSLAADPGCCPKYSTVYHLAKGLECRFHARPGMARWMWACQLWRIRSSKSVVSWLYTYGGVEKLPLTPDSSDDEGLMLFSVKHQARASLWLGATSQPELNE
jgi:hypothetical protein